MKLSSSENPKPILANGRIKLAVAFAVALCLFRHSADAYTTPQDSITVLLLSAASVEGSQPVRLHAIVAPSTTSCGSVPPACPRGEVIFSDGNTVVATAQTIVSGEAIVNLRLGIGPHSLAAKFAGNHLYTPSASEPQMLTVQGTSTTATTISATGSSGGLHFDRYSFQHRSV